MRQGRMKYAERKDVFQQEAKKSFWLYNPYTDNFFIFLFKIDSLYEEF